VFVESEALFVVVLPRRGCAMHRMTLFWCGRPSDSGGRLVKGGHVKDVANATYQGAKEGMLRRAATRTRDPPPRPPFGDT